MKSLKYFAFHNHKCFFHVSQTLLCTYDYFCMILLIIPNSAVLSITNKFCDHLFLTTDHNTFIVNQILPKAVFRVPLRCTLKFPYNKIAEATLYVTITRLEFLYHKIKRLPTTGHRTQDPP